jgi:TPR repeat protein
MGQTRSFDDTGFVPGFTLKVENRPADYEYTPCLRSTFAVLRNTGSLASAASDKIRQAGGERMRSVRSRTGAWAAVLALILGVVARVGSARAVEAGRYAPENIEQTYKQMRWLCMVAALCPVSDDVRIVIKRAIEGKPSAEYLLGLTLLTGDGLPRDESAGIAWTVRAAEHGDADAARDVADRLRNGAAIEVDETKIAAALGKKADAGDAEAMRALGPLYIRGRGVKQDPALGLDMMKRAVEKGSTGAANDLSRLYLLGAPGVPASGPESLKWLAVSARRGNADAMVTLGYMSMTTPAGVPSSERNLAQAFCWLIRAALLNQPQAQEKLSMMFARGEHDDHGNAVPADLVQADVWFRLAARSPFHDNSQIRAMIEPQMTTDQLNEAKRLVEAWRPRKAEELKTLEIALAAAPGAAARPCPAMP